MPLELLERDELMASVMPGHPGQPGDPGDAEAPSEETEEDFPSEPKPSGGGA